MVPKQLLNQPLRAVFRLTGGAIAAGVIALFDTHPLDDTQPLLDLRVAIVLMPCLLLGVTIGQDTALFAVKQCLRLPQLS